MAFFFGKSSSSSSASNAVVGPLAHSAAANVAQWRKNRQNVLQSWISDYVKKEVVTAILRAAQIGKTSYEFSNATITDKCPLDAVTADVDVQTSPTLGEWQGEKDGAWLQPSLIQMLKQQLEADHFNVQVEVESLCILFKVSWPNEPSAPVVATQATAPAEGFV